MTAAGGLDARPLLGPREDRTLPDRVARSAAALTGESAEEIRGWLHRRREEVRFSVDRVAFDDLDGWSFAPGTGNLVHRSGRFFTVEGLRACVGEPPGQAEWHQPVIVQQEVGILGVLAREFDGVLHFLMQAKMEPGNPELLQLSPTVQATYSNYTQVHKGAAVRYLEYFTDPSRGRVLSDVLQSEHGSWFHRKRNRNMVVEAVGPVPEHEDFRWLTLGQIHELLGHDHTVNMDARSALAGLYGPDAPEALHSDTDLLSWLAAQRSVTPVRGQRVPLLGLPGWTRGTHTVEHEQGRYFRVVGVSVQAGNREVGQWTQPLFEPCGQGVVAFLTRTIEGVPHVLVRARPEGGFLDAELGPTVQCTPGNHAHLPAAQRPPFLDLVTGADPSRVRYAALHSEEGGRFLDAVSRYLIVEADESEAPLHEPPGFRWVSRDQLAALARYSHYVSVQARTLLMCMNTLKA
ncbi:MULTISPECIES: NDP-hexose 2,3-dehydratase family protein [Streptomyces]|uniref:NDP-hexose 2,3-dehydratase family protein n=1 Tax=Streptomyces TaxID=1883 RepID=UPI001E2E9B01|nr:MULTISPECIES: NDP-hexose 2,3-dehydratase family protein [Streptomyces]UFQ18662.1 NDP-hexose 2,3-dehydratase family protein [Streptomyces huasconensis]WCL88277.1 NDP-hexose 2,3-dehydratase family protein [Streptomyces sp. JCM 35825]